MCETPSTRPLVIHHHSYLLAVEIKDNAVIVAVNSDDDAKLPPSTSCFVTIPVGIHFVVHLVPEIFVTHRFARLLGFFARHPLVIITAIVVAIGIIIVTIVVVVISMGVIIVAIAGVIIIAIAGVIVVVTVFTVVTTVVFCDVCVYVCL